jgi:hypothetical protein
MHSSEELRSDMFGIELDGQRVSSFTYLCPDFTTQDRLGVVVRHPLGAIWKSNFILAMITAFYDVQRRSGNDFFIYPDYFVFHAGCDTGNLSMLDIWPEHKCVSTQDHPEALLSAINDRAITHLLLDDREPCKAELQSHTRSSALSRLKHVWLSTVEEREKPEEVAGAIYITGNEIVEGYVQNAIDNTTTISDSERETIRSQRSEMIRNGSAREKYWRVSPEESFHYL